jgi:hypothetical protein
VTITGTPDALTVTLHGDWSQTVERLSPTTCETATDVVAAFVVSTLAPAPVRPEQKPAVPAAQLGKAIGDELARRGIQLAMLGTSLELERDASGSWSAELARKGVPECAELVSLGAIEAPTTQAVTTAAGTIETALSKQHACAARSRAAAAERRAAAERAKRAAARALPGAEPARRKALAEALDDVDSSADTNLGVAVLTASLGVGFLTVLGLSEGDWQLGFSDPSDALMTASATTYAVGGVLSLALPEDYRRASVLATNYAGLGLLWGGAGSDLDVPRHSIVAPVVGNLMTAELLVFDAAIHRPPVSRLRAARNEMRRSSPSPARVREIERDLERFDTRIPRWVIYLPMMIGGVVTALPPLRAESNYEDGHWPFLIGIQSLAIGLSGALHVNQSAHYERALERLGLTKLSLGPGPGDGAGLTLSGKF